MIKVEFCADNVAQLKNDIIGYAAALGGNFTTPTGAALDRAAELANPPAKATRAAKKKEPEAAPESTPSAPIAATTTPPIPSDAEVQASLVAVNDKFGIDKAIECLTKFGVKRGRELRDDQKAEFMALCKSITA